MESFGEAGQLMAAASGYKSQAGLLDVSAKGEIAAGELASKRVAVQGEKYVSRLRSMYAKAGVKFTGTPASVWAESERNAQLDIVNTKLNAAARANEYGWQAVQARMAAVMLFLVALAIRDVWTIILTESLARRIHAKGTR